jgi:hypothetical protein
VNYFDIILGVIFLIIALPFAIKAEEDLKSLKEFIKINDGYK